MWLYENETNGLWHVARMGEMWNANRDLVEKPERKRQFWRCRYRWQDNRGSLFYLTTIECHFLPIPNQISYQIQANSPARNTKNVVLLLANFFYFGFLENGTLAPKHAAIDMPIYYFSLLSALLGYCNYL